MRRGITKVGAARGLWKNKGNNADGGEDSKGCAGDEKGEELGGGSVPPLPTPEPVEPADLGPRKRTSAKKAIFGIFSKNKDKDAPGSSKAPDGRHTNKARGKNTGPQMPKDATLLSSCKIEDLHYFCGLKGIDYTQLSNKKEIVKALADTYPPKQERVLYLRVKAIQKEFDDNKDAHHAYKALKEKAKEDKVELDPVLHPKPPPLDPALMSEIDTLFDSLMEKLGVQILLRGIVSNSYSSEEKLHHLVMSVCVLDDHPHFSIEDEEMVTAMDSERAIDSIRLLTCKYRIIHSNEDWMSNFCMSGGISVLVENMDNRLEKEPLESNDAAALYELLLCLKEIMKTDGLKVALDTRGAIDAFVMSLRFEYKPLALEVLGLLAVVCTFGGTEAVWQTVMGLRHLARKREEEPFAVLIDAMTTQVHLYSHFSVYLLWHVVMVFTFVAHVGCRGPGGYTDFGECNSYARD